MRIRIFYMLFAVIAFSAASLFYGQTAVHVEVFASPTPTPHAAATPCNTIMPKVTSSESSPKTSGPVSVSASGSGVSMPLRDLPPVKSTNQEQEPREINPQNTFPIKTVKPGVSPCAQPELTAPTAQKKKTSRKKSRKNPS